MASLASPTWRANSTMTQAAISAPISSAIRRRVSPATGRSARLPIAAAAAGVGAAPGSGSGRSARSGSESAAVERAGGRDIGPRVASPDSGVNFARGGFEGREFQPGDREP